MAYDFLVWTSWPSSLKETTTRKEYYFARHLFYHEILIEPGNRIRVECMAKVENVAVGNGGMGIRVLDEARRPLVRRTAPVLSGTRPWSIGVTEFTVPEGGMILAVFPVAGGSDGVTPATTWWDDLKIYMDDVLIYDSDVTALRPGRIIPVKWTPPEILIGAWQRRKQKLEERIGGEIIPRPPMLLKA